MILIYWLRRKGEFIPHAKKLKCWLENVVVQQDPRCYLCVLSCWRFFLKQDLLFLSKDDRTRWFETKLKPCYKLGLHFLYFYMTEISNSACCSRDMIATSCEDKNIRIFYIAASTDQPLKIFKGKSRSVQIRYTKHTLRYSLHVGGCILPVLLGRF